MRGVPRWVLAAGSLALVLAVAAAVRWWPGSAATPNAGRAGSGAIVESVISVTSEDGVEVSPSLSPDGKWVVYAADEQGTGQLDILLRAVGGQNVINLTKDSSADDTQPAFSPDGERIAFRSGRPGGSGLYVMGRTGETPDGAAVSLRMAAEGRFKALIDRVLPLSQAPQAHELVESRSGIGKVVLDPTQL